MPDTGLLEGRSALVTGGAGFIGSHLVDGLLTAGVRRVHVLDDLSLGRRENLSAAIGRSGVELMAGDAADLELLRSLAQAPYDLCFNLAVIPLPHSLEHPRENVDLNLAMTSAVCELGRQGGYRKLVHFSSSEVYGTARRTPMDESHPLGAHTPYAAAKAATDLVVASYATTFDLPAVTVRPFNTYGERQNAGAYAGLIPAVVGAVLRGEPVTVHGDGEQTRDMTYVGDIVSGALAAAASEAAVGRTLNLGAGREATVNELVTHLLAALGREDHPVERGPARPGDVRRLLADISEARHVLGYSPRTDLAEGLSRTVAWYLEQAPATAT